MSSMQHETYFKVSVSDGRFPRDVRFSNLGDAIDAVARFYSWNDVFVSIPFEDTHGQAWCAYPTEFERDADCDGATAPRINKHLLVPCKCGAMSFDTTFCPECGAER